MNTPESSSPPAPSALNADQAQAALLEAIALTHQLLEQLPQRLAEALPSVEADQQRRAQLIEQLFSYPWSAEQVQAYQAEFAQLEALDQQLKEEAVALRQSLHQQRVDNQYNRKAVNAYGQAKGQFSR